MKILKFQIAQNLGLRESKDIVNLLRSKSLIPPINVALPATLLITYNSSEGFIQIDYDDSSAALVTMLTALSATFETQWRSEIGKLPEYIKDLI